MKQIIERTMNVAYDYLLHFGFEEDKVKSTVSKGIKELESNLQKLKELVYTNSSDIEEVDYLLHSIKGILFQLGNSEDGKKVDEVRDEIDMTNVKSKIEHFIK